MTVTTFVINVVLIGGSFLIRRWFHDRQLRNTGNFEQDNRLQMRPITLGFVLALNSIIVSSTISWLPPEIISVERQPNVTARVLAADGDWTTYLDTKRKVYITATKTIQSRVPCSTDTSIFSKPIMAAVFNERQNNACAPDKK